MPGVRVITNPLPATLHEPDPHLLDAFGVRYTGPVSHLTLVAMARDDLTPALSKVDHVRLASRRLADVFAAEELSAEHDAALRALSAADTCLLVMHLAVDGGVKRLYYTGPEDVAPLADWALRAVDRLRDDDRPPAIPFIRGITPPAGRALAVTATGPDGASHVAVGLELAYRVREKYRTTRHARVPVAELHRLLVSDGTDADELAHWVRDTGLLDRALADTEPHRTGKFTKLTITGPADPTDDTPALAPTAPAVAGTALTVYYVGRDHEHALRDGLRFLDPADAESAVLEGERVFTATFTMTDLRPH